MDTISELLEACDASDVTFAIARAIQRWQAREDGVSVDDVRARMYRALCVMRESAQTGLNPALRSVSGRVGGQAAMLRNAPHCAVFGMLGRATAYALAIAECNACMGKIVAAPTAGACGILPGVLLAVQECEGYTDELLVDALFTASAIGRVIALQATISGAEGGCQAECGAASAMTAAALCELFGGAPEQATNAAGFAIMNSLGLVCDPVAGLVEIPCVYRNVGGVGTALTAAEMALAGIHCPLPCDELIRAMKEVGDALPPSLRETGDGGCAACASARGLYDTMRG